MIHLNLNRVRRTATALAALLAACIALAACGGSGGSTTASTATTRSAVITGRLAKLRECLQKNGIPLAGGSGVVLLLGAQLPKGVTRAQYEATLRKCVAGGSSSGNQPVSVALLKAVGKYVACMRSNGVSMPPPNASGNGPVINTTGVNLTSAVYKAAQRKCGLLLQRIIQAGPGAGELHEESSKGSAPAA
jgi:hypothetical protein